MFSWQLVGALALFLIRSPTYNILITHNNFLPGTAHRPSFVPMKKRRRKKAISYREWFEMSSGEQRGVIVLLTLIVVLIGCNFLVPFFIHPKSEFLNTDDLAWIDWSKSDTITEDIFQNREEIHSSQTAELFRFDPNILDESGWKRLGLHNGQIKSIRNYLSKGGKFRTVNDLSKMYVISPELFEQLKPFVDLPETEKPLFIERHDSVFQKRNFPEPTWPSTKDDFLIVELNAADTIQLKKLRGIGAYLARKIVEYRDRLGGFRNFEQLAEIYRVTPGKADTLKQKMTLDLSMITRMNLNDVTLDRLKKFPYLQPSQSQALMAYREKHGPFKTVFDMKKCVLIDQSTFEKVRDYFEVK